MDFKSGLLEMPTKTSACLSTLIHEGEAYLRSNGVETPRQESQAILQNLLSINKIDFYIEPARPVSVEDQTAFFQHIKRRGQREPLQYILGEVDFYGLPFFVAPGVFIPRPETELIIERTLSLSMSPRSILDICTGSGALAIVLAKKFPSACITAIDCSETALAVARKNQERHQTPSVHFLMGDLFDPLNTDNRFDLIVCNPPYIAENEWQKMDPEVLKYEPHLALFSPDNGQAHLKRILTQAPDLLSENGQLLLEIGAGQSPWLSDFVKEETPFSVQFHQDWAGIDRIASCQWTK
jgi:release factor glutamine methyltransferase